MTTDNDQYPKADKTSHLRKYASWEAIKLTVQSVGTVTSRQKYLKWHAKVKPRYMPKYPHRVYPEWISWSDFLGTDNSWNGYDLQLAARRGDAWRPYWEAVRYVQKLGIKTKNDWHAYCREKELPEDIPRAPDKTYGDDWTGWRSWLGKESMNKVESAVKVEGIIGLCYNSAMPNNMVEVVVAREGLGQMEDALADRPYLDIFKAYVINEDSVITDFNRVMQVFASKQDNAVWLVPNMSNLMFELDNNFSQFRRS